jgi:hypothetical protein
MDNDAMSLLAKQMNEDIQQITQVIAAGASADFPEYKYLCGQVLGLTRAMNYVKDMEQRLQRADD